jgi:hypothetical protein
MIKSKKFIFDDWLTTIIDSDFNHCLVDLAKKETGKKRKRNIMIFF